MASSKSFICVLVVIVCAAMLAGLCLSPPSPLRVEAADRVASQCGEFAAMELLSSLGKALAKAALQKVAGWAMGKVMKSLGMGGPTTQDIMDKLDADMAEINAKLDAIAEGINRLENELAVYFDKSQALSNYKDLDTYCTNIKTAYDGWMLKWLEPYIGDEDHPKIPPEKGTPEYDAMQVNLTKWANNMAADTYDVSKSMGQIHQDLVNPIRSVLQGIVDVAIDETAVEWGGQDFGTTVRSTNGVPVVADRVMYTRGDLSGAICGGGVEPGKVHYFAEGYVSRAGDTAADTFVLIQNGNADRSANVRVTFYVTGLEKKTLNVKVAPNSRYTVVAGDHMSGEFGMKVESDVDVSVERSCYLEGRLAGSTVNDDAGLALKKTYAEGYVVPGYFNTYFTLMNPDPGKTARVSATFFRQDATVEKCTVEVGPEKRSTIDAGNYLEGEFSTVIESTNGVPVVSERLVYAQEGKDDRPLAGATVSEGDSHFSASRYFAEGYVVPGYFDTYFTLINPGSKASVASFSFLKADGTSAETRVAVDPGKRVTVNAGDFAQGEFATEIRSTTPIASERITYARPGAGGALYEANIGEGTDDPRLVWNFAEGTNRKNLGARTFITIANTGTKTAKVEVTFRTSGGATWTRTLSVPPRGAHDASADALTEVSGSGGRVTVDAGAEVQASVVDGWYNKLEDTFVGAVYQRASAANMTVEYMGYLGQDPQYWWKNYTKEETAEVQKFLEQAYRLAMSHVDLVEQPGIAPFTDVTRNIINRANYVANIVLNKCDYQNPGDPDYKADLASQSRLIGTVILDGQLAGGSSKVSVTAAPLDAGTPIEGSGTYQTVYVEKFRPQVSMRVVEYYDSWKDTAMTPRNDLSLFNFSIPGVAPDARYKVTIRLDDGTKYDLGTVKTQSVGPDGLPYDPKKSSARIDILPFVYYYRTGGLAKAHSLLGQFGQYHVDENSYCNPIYINKDYNNYWIYGQLEDASSGHDSDGSIGLKMPLNNLNASADGNIKQVYVYPWVDGYYYLETHTGAITEIWQTFLKSVNRDEELTSEGFKTNKRGGNWESYRGHGHGSAYSLPDTGWDLNMTMKIHSQHALSHACAWTSMRVSGFCFGFY